MLHIRELNENDDLNQYMECVKDLNGSSSLLNSIEQMRRVLVDRPTNIITYVVLQDGLIVAAASCVFEHKIRYNKLCCHIEDVGGSCKL